MNKATVKSFIVKGDRVVPVSVEVAVQEGIGIHLIGLDDTAVKEVLLRTCTALQACGYRVPGRKLVISVKAEDGLPVTQGAAGLDLPVALAILEASEQVSFGEATLDHLAFAGELGLDGSIRRVRGAYAMALASEAIVLPEANALDIAFCPRIGEEHKVYSASRLNAVVFLDRGVTATDIASERHGDDDSVPDGQEADLALVDVGPSPVLRHLLIAAAGGHPIRLRGGNDPRLLERCLLSILPRMSEEEAIETALVYDAAGEPVGGRIGKRPARFPVASSSIATLVGGGAGCVLPGEVSLAHNGLLVLPDPYTMPRSALEAVRIARDEGRVTIYRLRERVVFPARFLLVGETRYGVETEQAADDLFDIVCDAPDVRIRDQRKGVSSADFRAIVSRARQVQAQRYAGTGISLNAQLSPLQINTYYPVNKGVYEAVEALCTDKPGLRTRILRVARTIADIEGDERVEATHVIEAAGLVSS